MSKIILEVGTVIRFQEHVANKEDYKDYRVSPCSLKSPGAAPEPLGAKNSVHAYVEGRQAIDLVPDAETPEKCMELHEEDYSGERL